VTSGRTCATPCARWQRQPAFAAAAILTLALGIGANGAIFALVDVFGGLAYSIERRVRDIGVRRTLGATAGDVIRLVVGDAARVVAAGAAIGLIASVVSGRALDALLFGVHSLDPATFVAVACVLIVTGVVSVAGPARRALRIDPVVALRSE
jgi:ABC-type antimicrobial peptide transport system permease subunit